MSNYFLSAKHLNDLTARLLARGKVIGPVEAWGRKNLEEITRENLDQLVLTGFRAVESLKSFLFAISEEVLADPKSGGLVFLGARGCDLEALEVLDKVFGEGEFTDPFYTKKREKLLIIGADCTSCGKTCFCTLVGGQPYPTKLFDINLSPVEGGYVVEVGTDKGRKLVEENKELFAKTEDKAKEEEKEEGRKKVERLLEEANKEYELKQKLSDLHRINLNNSCAWREMTKNCVECSACNFICPTCTCFLLVDSADGRHKEWDACLKTGYARVAGGSNSRPKLYERLQNRYQCKFDYSFERLNRYTCVGCGRCIDGCAGNIEMRKIFKELERQAPLTAKLV